MKVFFFSLLLASASAFQPLVSSQRKTIHLAQSSDPIIESLDLSERRKFLGSIATAAAFFALPLEAAQARGKKLDYKAVASDIASLVKADPDKGPTLIRVAWHSSGSYAKDDNSGGSRGGTMRFPSEQAHGGNAGLASTAVSWLEPIHAKYSKQGLSYGDLYTLSGVVAVKEAGGPIVPWSSGRIDEPEEAVTPDGRLPNAETGPKGADPSDAQHLRDVFYRMGFDDREIVALSGAHALGRCHTTASGYDGPWSPTPTTLNNAYFTLMSNLKWVPKEWDGPFQYVDAPTGKLMMLPSDLVLLQDESFLKWVKAYGSDEKLFLSDFSDAFAKLLSLGTSGLTPTEWA